ncbi:MAG: hypothetical protein HYU39_00535 [Thaumarchaeota archaeon]|nr:hypothetical protein [Nitrososphaerota archaeon]
MVHTLISASPIPFIIAIVVLLAKQRGSYFRPVQTLLIIGHSLLATTLILEFIRDFVQTIETVYVLTTLAVSVAALSSLPLILTGILLGKAYTIYPKKSILQILLSDRTVALPIIIVAGYIAALILAAWLFTPFSFGVITDSFGTSFFVIHERWYSLGLGGLALLVIYPMRLMIKRSREVHSKVVSKALIVLPVSWLFLGASLYLFKVFLVTSGMIAALGTLLASIPWAATAYLYSRP